MYYCTASLYSECATAGSHIKNARYTDAMNMLMRFAMACDAAHATNSQCKAYLSAVVVGLYSGNATETWATYQVRFQIMCLLRAPKPYACGMLQPQLLAACSNPKSFLCALTLLLAACCMLRNQMVPASAVWLWHLMLALSGLESTNTVPELCMHRLNT